MKRILLLFVDGVGVGRDDAVTNAFVARPPATLTGLLDGAHIAGQSAPLSTTRATLIPLDAQLGVEGLPQSGTGQYTLLTGHNGAAEFGRHYGPWVPTALRAPLQHTSLLTRANSAGLRVAFANAYPEELIASAHTNGTFTPIGPLRAGPPLAAAGAGLLTRHTAELMEGRALSSEITNEAWRERLHRTMLPVIDARTAGVTLARIANEHDLTMFAHYATDYAGHQQDLQQAIDALELVDAFVGGLLEELDPSVTLVIVSDHGNLEDASAGHTRNPAICIVAGSGHEGFGSALRSLIDVAPAILGELGVT